MSSKVLDPQLFTKSGKPRKRKPKQKNVYFTDDTQTAILAYISETDQVVRNTIYREQIEYAFFKLSQNIINTYKLQSVGNSVEDLQQEVIEHVLQKLHLFDPNLGKAYSYFGTIMKRYFLGKNKKEYDRKLDHVDLDLNTYDILDQGSNSFGTEVYNLDQVIIDFKYLVKSRLNVMFIPDKRDEKADKDMNNIDTYKAIAESVLHLFDRIESLDIFNKKAILLFLREMHPSVDNKMINHVLKKIHLVFKEVNLSHIEDGALILSK